MSLCSPEDLLAAFDQMDPREREYALSKMSEDMALMAKARQQLLTFNPTGLHRYDKHRASTAVKLIPARRKHKPGDLVGPDLHKKGLEHHAYGMEKMVGRRGARRDRLRLHAARRPCAVPPQ